MLYVFLGAPKQVIEKVEATIASLLAKSPNALVVRVEEDMVATLPELLQEQGLFKANYIVYINALSSEPLRDWALENLALLKESTHLCLLALEEVNDKEKKEIEKSAEKVQECKEQQEVRREKGEGGGTARVSGAHGVVLAQRDPFAISDALLTKDTKRLFVELEHARLGGERGEEVIGTLFWAAKTMAQALSAKNADEAGLKPYPYQKATAGVRVWGHDGVETLVYSLATASQRAYANSEDIFTLLERELCG